MAILNSEVASYIQSINRFIWSLLTRLYLLATSLGFVLTSLEEYGVIQDTEYFSSGEATQPL